MKKKLLLWLMCLMSTVGMSAQTGTGYTFKAAALNVDGLPNEEYNLIITTINPNPDGKNEVGATMIREYLANSGIDIFGFCEDFNFHNQVVADPAGDFYNFGEHGGSISAATAINRSESDGLGFAAAKWLTIGSVTKGTWSGYNGRYDNGADGMITKGYRMYQTIIADGVLVDVYVLHMDAGDTSDDIAMREKQLGELVTAIKTSMARNKRPTIILGDTNCRYTRENLKTKFIDVINAESTLTIKDPWIELVRDGVYPTNGSDALMTHTYGMQKGEVVDKVFYINTTQSAWTLKANSYLHDPALKASDHYPVVVSFTISNPNVTPTDVEESNRLEGPADEVVLTDGTPTNPTTDISGVYYLRNVSTGKYLNMGGQHSTHAYESVHVLPVTLSKVGTNTYSVQSHTLGNVFLGVDYFVDQGQANWVVKEIVRSDGVKKYVFLNPNNNSMALASVGGGNIDGAAYDVNDTKQHWMLCTADWIKEEMQETLEGVRYNASALIPYGRVAANWGTSDSRHTLWNGAPAFNGWEGNGGNHCMEKHFWGGETQIFDVYQEITGLPEGTYTLTAHAFHRSGDHGTSSTTVLPDLYATNGNSTTKTVKICSVNTNAPATKPNNMPEAGQAFVNGYYKVTLENVTVGADGALRIGVRNTSADNSARMWVCFNDFQLLYHGSATGDLKGSELYKEIKAAVDEANALIATQPQAVQNAYAISAVKYRYNNNLVSNDGALEIKMIDEAVMAAVKSQNTVGSDLTLAIANHSFETGDLTGWTVLYDTGDTGAKTNSGDFATTDTHGTFLFNTWTAAADGAGPLTQTITGLANGYYKLQALVTAWTNRTIYLVGNKQIAGKVSPNDGEAFVEHEVNFLVEDGVAEIATVADCEGKFNYRRGTFFKADNYRLKLIGTTGQGRYEIALADAKKKAATLEAEAKAQFDANIASYEGLTISGDGKAEAAAIETILVNACKAQKFGDAEMTWVIQNPNFETGDFTGWTVTTQWDTKVGHQSSSISADYADGLYLFNTWNDFVDPKSNLPIKQTITGLPNGTYRLTAAVTSGAGNKVFVFANNTSGEGYTAEAENKLGDTSVEFEVTNGTAEIGVVGANDGVFNIEGGSWYKADNFRLTYLGSHLVLNEANALDCEAGKYSTVALTRTIKANTWSTFVVPFDIPEVGEWKVMELTGAENNDGHVTLSFEKRTEVKAGVPYMVRYTADWNLFEATNAEVVTAVKPVTVDGVTFNGTFVPGVVPTGAFFINANNFYQADGTNNIKAYRGYFTVEGGANINKMSFVFDGDETAIENVEMGADAEVVAIYSLDGRRIEKMQRGINIVKMSDGKTKKVMVK